VSLPKWHWIAVEAVTSAAPAFVAGIIWPTFPSTSQQLHLASNLGANVIYDRLLRHSRDMGLSGGGQGCYGERSTLSASCPHSPLKPPRLELPNDCPQMENEENRTKLRPEILPGPP
jgi:hypothetical protein